MSVLGRTRDAASVAVLSLLLFGLLAASAWALPDYDGDGVLPPQDCNNLSGAAAPGKPDLPDLAFEDTNCDGIDGNENAAVFVSASAANDNGTGSKENPLRTIAAALTKASAENKDVYVIGGTYVQGTIALVDGVGLYGGYTPVTGQRRTNQVTVIRAAREAMLADSDQGVVLQFLTLESTPDATSRSAYGLRALNGSTVVLSGVTLDPGNAISGIFNGAGNVGLQGDVGTDGVTGPGCLNASPGAVGSPGGASAQLGGTGGDGGSSFTFGSFGKGGATGTGSGGGVGGAGGLQNSNVGGPGSAGNPGLPATGVGSTGASPPFIVGTAGALWVGPSGAHGGTGPSGAGGGGGGGGATGFAIDPNHDAHGGSGGGGGGGGHGGQGGRGGGFGGGSFGVYAVNSSVVVERSTASPGNGGAGANGGLGGGGGGGGTGGLGSAGGSCATPTPTTSGGGGGGGGNGGAGGNGGPGGGGTGGPSIGIFTAGGTGSFVQRNNVFALGNGGIGGLQGGSASVRAGAGARLNTSGAASTTANFDGDGRPDATDLCPDVVAPAGDADGCPNVPAKLADTDGDQIPNTRDRCPTTARGSDANEDGCPDVAPPPPPPPGIDQDRDGFFAGQDCIDTNPAIRPGAQEIVGNTVDENCDGVATPFPTITSAVGNDWSVLGRRLRATELIARGVPAGSRGQIRCTGRRCAFKRKTARARGGSINFLKALKKKQRQWRAGQMIEVRITAPSYNGKVVRYTLKRNKIPKGKTLCLPNGTSRPVRSC